MTNNTYLKSINSPSQTKEFNFKSNTYDIFPWWIGTINTCSKIIIIYVRIKMFFFNKYNLNIKIKNNLYNMLHQHYILK